jgi:hypothetical protein
MIPICTQFDEWTYYDNSQLEDYTLYRIYYKPTQMILITRFHVWCGLTFKQLQHIELTTIHKQTLVCGRL